MPTMRVINPTARYDALKKRLQQKKDTLENQYRDTYDLDVDTYIDRVEFWHDSYDCIAGAVYEVYNRLSGYVNRYEENGYLLKLTPIEKVELIRRFAVRVNDESHLARYIATMFDNLHYDAQKIDPEAAKVAEDIQGGVAGSEESKLEAKSLPVEAPEKYLGLRSAETPPEFINRVYGRFMGKGLNVGYLRGVDPSLVRSLAYYRQSGGKFPDDFDLPAGKPGKIPFTAGADADRDDIEKGAVRRFLREKQARSRSKS